MSQTAGPIHRTGVDRRAPLADVVISRNGAGTIAELAARAKPAALGSAPGRPCALGRRSQSGRRADQTPPSGPLTRSWPPWGKGGGASLRRSRSAPLTGLRLPPR
jgi:hypothetical protein